MTTTQTPSKEATPTPKRREYTTATDRYRYQVMADNKKDYIRKEKSPEGLVFRPIQVVPQLENVSFDRGESVDRFFVITLKRDSTGATTPVSDEFDPAAGSFYEYCEDFCKAYQIAP